MYGSVAEAPAQPARVSTAALLAAVPILAAAALYCVEGPAAFLTTWRYALEAPMSLWLLAAAPGLYAASTAIGAARAKKLSTDSGRRQRHELKLLMEASGDIVLQLDRTGGVVAVDQSVLAQYGLVTDDLLGRALFQRVHIGDRPMFLKRVSDALQGDTGERMTLRLQTGFATSASGHYAEPVFGHFEVRLRRLAAPDAPDAALLCLLRDDTAARNEAAAISAARVELDRSFAAKDRFLANVSHELRTPLNAIIGFSEILSSPELAPQNAAQHIEYAEIIKHSGQHLLAVVNTILDMSKIEAGAMRLAPEAFRLPALLDECCDMIQLQARRGDVALIRDYAIEEGIIVADPRACKQIVINLLSNAVKFTPAGGHVRLQLRQEESQFVMKVTDSGVGISAADLARLGDPFFRASATPDHAHEGTGLGLSVVRGLVGLHGGSIVIESARHKGTSATIRLPADCRAHVGARADTTKIETIALHDVVRAQQQTVKKIA